jgi:hypothetical protein
MSRPDRRNTLIVAVIGAVAVLGAALIGYLKKEPKGPPPVNTTVEQPKTENTAKTTGSQSPAVAGAKDVTVNYGQTPTKDKPAK